MKQINSLTPARRRVLNAFRSLTVKGQDIPPTVRRLCEHLKAGNGSVQTALRLLVRDGYLVHLPRRKGWALTKKGGAA